MGIHLERGEGRGLDPKGGELTNHANLHEQLKSVTSKIIRCVGLPVDLYKMLEIPLMPILA